jgi:NO-binding membrane sensor protein with MHYT domain
MNVGWLTLIVLLVVVVALFGSLYALDFRQRARRKKAIRRARMAARPEGSGTTLDVPDP